MATLEEMKQCLLADNINYALVMRMTAAEITKAYSITDYEEYNDYMRYMAHKYDI